MLSDPKKKLTVRVCCEDSDDSIPVFYRSFPLRETEPVGAQLQRELPFWTPANPVLLDLPPGAGKTSFVYDVLIPAALAQGKNLLLVSNRVALSFQQKRAILERLRSPLPRLLTDEGVRQTEDFGPVRVITYHRLSALVDDPDSAPWLNSLLFAVFDECHYFTSDALFNSYAEHQLRLACQRFCHAVRIYMTGTSWDVLRPLAEAEMRFYHRRTFYPQWTLPRECIRYTLPVHSDRYRLHFFHTLEDLSSLIAEQPRAKWMIFVDSKARGRRFAQELSVPTTYLDAESKGSDVWEHIIREKEFSTQVLVTTSALDVGIDIIDPEVQNVAVIADNRTALLQMAGRRRLQAGERIDLWVCDLPKAAVSARLRKYQDWLHWYSRLDACRRPEHHWALAAQLWCQEDPALRVLFRLGKERIFPNQLARYALRRRCFLLERIQRGETTFRREAALWLGMDPDASGAVAALHRFYAEHGGQALDTVLQGELRQLINNCYAESGHRERQPDRLLKNKHHALTNRLEEMQLPYSIVTRGDAWLLTKTNHCEEVT